MELFDISGVRLAANVSGPEGAMPLLLLHSGATPKSSWDAVAPALTKRHRVYAVDMRGYGDSDRPGHYSFELMRDDILGLMDTLGAAQVDLIGHSMGGTVAWLVAQAQPHRVRRMVIEDTPVPRTPLPRIDLGPPEMNQPFDYAALLAVMEQIYDPDPQWWQLLPTVTASTLMLLGDEAKREPMRDTLALMPNARMAEILVGHHIHRVALDEFLAVVVPFLDAEA